MESGIKTYMKNLFPLQVKSEGIYLGMGESGIRYQLLTNDGKNICYSDYKPNINEINMIVKAAIESLV